MHLSCICQLAQAKSDMDRYDFAVFVAALLWGVGTLYFAIDTLVALIRNKL